jgi:hypothetical protein
MIIMIALLFMVEVHIRKLSIHTFALCSPLPSEMEVQIVGEHAVAAVIADMNATMDHAIEKLLTPAPVADGIRKHLGYRRLQTGESYDVAGITKTVHDSRC